MEMFLQSDNSFISVHSSIDSYESRSRMRCAADMLDLTRFRTSAHGHECDGMSRVVMVRKTDQRTFASNKIGQEPKLETVTTETVETYHGNKIERKVTSLQKRDAFDDLTPELLERTTVTVSPSSSRLKKSSSSLSSAEDFAENCLKAHNECRLKHGVAPLKLNKNLCKVSQQWANKLATRGMLEHSKTREYGENLYCLYTSDTAYQPAGREAVDNWYAEIDKHTFGVEPRNLETGHFTQIIWKDTKELGVAFAKSTRGVFVVANYSPPGNYIGHYTENVPPIGGFKNGVNGISPDIKSTPKHEETSQVRWKDEITTDFETECLNAHNEYRKLHGVDSLKLNRRLCKYSEEWAKVLATKGQMEHRKTSDYGENIFCSWSSNTSHTISGREPVDNWYKEIKYHTFGREPSSLKSGHFTQVVWKDSIELGVGMARNRNGQIFVVANYSPPGNFVGSFNTNVLPIVNGEPRREKHEDLKKKIVTKETSDESFSKEIVKFHNEYRKKHGVPDIKYSRKLTQYAKEWAQTLASQEKLYHRPNCPYGENIFHMWSSDLNAVINPKDVCKNWYDEMRDYQWGVNGAEVRCVKNSTGHFTQMVWKESTELGVGIARGLNNGKVYVVANYNPRGNIIGQFHNNVLRPR